MKSAIVTGATGFIGKALVKRLLEEGIFVYGVDIEMSRFDELKDCKNFLPVIAEFEDYKDLKERIGDRCVDVFYHLAWEGGFTTAMKDYKLQMKNAAYAGDALVAAKNIGCRKFVYAGTYNEFEIRTFLETESFEPRYTCIYATGKTAADLICRTLAFNLGIEYNIAFIPMPYGEYNYSMQLMNVVIDSLNRGIAPKLIVGENPYDIVYISDIVDGLMAIGENGRDGRGYYIGHRKLRKFKDWIQDIRDVIAPKVELRFGEYKDRQCIDYSKIDLNALYQDTGFECHADFEKSIKATAEWVKRNINTQDET